MHDLPGLAQEILERHLDALMTDLIDADIGDPCISATMTTGEVLVQVFHAGDALRYSAPSAKYPGGLSRD